MKAGWQQTTLGSVAQVGAGNPAPQGAGLFADGIHPFFRTSDAGRVRFGDITESSDYLNDFGINGLRRFPAGTILFPKSGASTFLNHRVMLGVDGYVSSHLATIVGDEAKVDRRFLLYFLSTVSAQNLIQDHAYPSLNLPLIAGIPVPLPPLPEQHRIVATLDVAFDGIATAKSNAEKNLQNARALFESHLQSVFTERGEGWGEKALEQVTSIINGFAFKSGDFSPDAGAKCIKITNVGVREFVCESGGGLPTEFASKYASVAIPAGSIVIALTRTIISGGLKVAVVPPDYDKALLNQRVAAILPNRDGISLPFLFAYLSTQEVAAYVKERVNTLMQPNLSIGDLRSMPIPVPPIRQQEQITGLLSALADETQRLESIYQQKLTALGDLKKSLLHQAFSGQL